MADKNYTNKLGIDVSEFKRAMSEINANLKNLHSQIKYNTIASGEYNQVIKLYNETIDKSIEKEKMLEDDLKRLKNAREQDTKAIANAEKRLYDQKTATENLKQEMQEYIETQKKASDAVDKHSIKLNTLGYKRNRGRF